MDFFESQDRAKRQTLLLLFLYFLAIALIILAVYAAIVIAFDFAGHNLRMGEPVASEGFLRYWDAPLFGAIAGGTLLVIGAGSIYRILELRGDGGKVATLLGGIPVNPSTDDPAAKRFVNVVEEMSIASGTTVPRMFILERESGINAFAAGTSPDNAAVAVTRGTLETLNRDELQGVIAHEFSHILNGDMRLNVRLMGLLNGILIIHLMGMVVLRGLFVGSTSRSRRYSGGGFLASMGRGRSGRRGSGRGDGGGGGGIIIAIIALAIALTIIGYLGVVFARLIQSAVSRQREYLADAAAVQFTRNPSGIAGALKKIGGMAFKGEVRSAHSVEAGHFFFANAMSRSSANLFATHPPLRKRILAIDPFFNGEFPVVASPQLREEPARQAYTPAPRRQAVAGGSALPGSDFLPVRPEILLASIGTLGGTHQQRASQILKEFPDSLRDAAHDTLGAKAIVYLLLTSNEEQARNRQFALLQEKADPRVLSEFEKLQPEMDAVKPEGRLPLLDISIPALRGLSVEQYRHFKSVVAELIAADEKVSLFEFCLERILFRRLDEAIEEKKPGIAQFHSFRAVSDDVSILLSALAHIGKKDTTKAFESAMSRLSMIRSDVRIVPEDACTPEEIGKSLDRLAQISPPMKKRFLQAASFCVASDGQLAVEEGELLRAIADGLGCPMPPILGGSAPS